MTYIDRKTYEERRDGILWMLSKITAALSWFSKLFRRANERLDR